MLNEITKFTNSYLNMLTKLKNLKSLFEEYCKLMLFEYNFKEVRSQSSNDLFVTVKKMHLFPIKHVLVANRIPLHKTLGTNLKVVENLMKYVKLEDSIIAVLTDESSFDAVDVNFETFKGIDLKKVPVDKLAFKSSDLFKIEDFPKTNLFLKNTLKINLERKVYNVPEQIVENSKSELWYKKESSELLSLTSVNLLISNDEFRKNARLASVCDLILVISEMQMQELFFQIREAGFLYRVEFNRFGFNISATGSDEIINVFKQILTNFKNVATPEKLSRAKKIALRNYENALKNKFMSYLDLLNCLLFKNHHSIQERKAEIENVELNDLNRMMNMILNESRRSYLIQGNYTVEDANKFFNEIELMFEYKIDGPIDRTTMMKATDCTATSDSTTSEPKIPATKSTINQTYNVKTIQTNESSLTESDSSNSTGHRTSSSARPEQVHSTANELFPKRATEYYCLAKLSIDSPEPVLNDETTGNDIDLSISCETPDSSYTFKSKPDNKRYIESTSVKNIPNRKLFMETNSCITYNASRIERANISRTKSNSILSSVCTDITNVNYNLSPLNNTNNDSHHFSSIINKDTQIVGNLYFTNYEDDVQHSLLLRILVALIKQNMNGFFTNEQNKRDDFFSAKSGLKNLSTPEITFQDQVLIDGQIECAEFELTNSKGFIFIVFDNYLLLNTKSIDSLAESFLGPYMFNEIDDLTDEKFNEIVKQLLSELNRKPTWSQDAHRNWNEIVLSKRRFELANQQRIALNTKVKFRTSN